MNLLSPTSLVLWCLGAFLCGSIPFGLVLVKLAGKGDVRQHGSGNIGATNVSRVGGKALGIVTLLLDVLKGFLPVFIAKKLGLGESALSLLALAAVLGHMFTPWLAFKGGKGVATALGVALAFRAGMVLPALGVFIVILLAFRYVSLGSVLSAFALPLILVWKGATPVVLLLWVDIALLVIIKHHENIRRLLKGTEAPLWGAKKEVADV
ncbi:glycerol-3-phosphate 1-O-acyltransferase PlsY [Geothrix sp. PMB-07]|uniref:glycerol-3-phosphate 1-O-acyltransferase PlsY n=1 Tax=Geothrix sp. PMB-07 TaxID=3068640 RepID=UPI002741A5F1|nr:glycerol-3-phosphate 1-O-acyltransferase PlsY [Geothrix sp. PMB-07]WLT30010.1 glycerol-3-phosphate 1-O-acyltransferase PlsY [Geothrix sp. PMB-07]